MPIRYENVPAELFMEHAGVKVYRTYKNDDVDQGARAYWFTTEEYGTPDLDVEEAFDVRILPDYVEHPNDIQTAIRKAIDKGIIIKGS